MICTVQVLKPQQAGRAGDGFAAAAVLADVPLLPPGPGLPPTSESLWCGASLQAPLYQYGHEQVLLQVIELWPWLQARSTLCHLAQ